jgi:CRISPR-associated protein Csb1
MPRDYPPAEAKSFPVRSNPATTTRGRVARHAQLAMPSTIDFHIVSQVVSILRTQEDPMSKTADKALSLEQLQHAVAGPTAAIRLRTRLQPAGGPGDKIFPPTYAGGMYACEDRRQNGQVVRTVLLDSVQSQANRLEQALLRAYDLKKIAIPLLTVNFSAVPEVGRITTLDAPHRIADAIFRDSLLGDVEFRASEPGKRYEAATVRSASALFELCPTALIFGTWDSTGARGGSGNKFARALVSEIVAVDAVIGVRTSSRIDPTGIRDVELLQGQDGGYTVDPAKAVKEKDKPRQYAVKGKAKKASEINLGNVTPDLFRASDTVRVPKTDIEIVRRGEILPGGITMSHAEQTTVLSLPGLRRLRFPDAKGKLDPARDTAAHVALAALALAAVALQREQGYDLRSRCLLVPEEESRFELVMTTRGSETFALAADAAVSLLTLAVNEAKRAGLPWHDKPLELRPKEALVELVRKSREVTDGEAT